MSRNAELAVAAARIRTLAERIPEEYRPDVATAWAELMQAVEATRSEGAAVVAIREWREAFEARLCAALAHAPAETR